MGFITGDRKQLELLGYSVDELVEQSSRPRFIVDLVDRLDLKEVYDSYSDQGGDALEPSIMLATWFLAYCEGITSSRRIEKLCQRDLHYIYISAHLRPDHCGLSRFRQRHAHRLPSIFVQIVRLAQEQGLSNFKRLSIDGSKLEAFGSPRKSRKKKALEKELSQLQSDIDRYLKDSEQLDAQTPELEKLQEQQAKLEACQEVLEQRQSELQSKDHDKHKVNITEPEARSMGHVNAKSSVPAYNAQLAVDEKTQFIASAHLCDQTNDLEQFKEVHEETEQTLGKQPDRKYTADSGYHSLEQLEYVQEAGVDAVIAEPRSFNRQSSSKEKAKFSRGDFHYDEQANHYVCPADQILKFWYKGRMRGRLLWMYKATHCQDCALRAKCLAHPENPKSFRKICRDCQEHLAEQMLAISQSAQGKQRLKRRAQSVEPVFGNLKHNLGFRRFNLRGMAQAQGEFSLMCIAHNILKWEKLTTPQRFFWPIMRLAKLIRAYGSAISITARSYRNIFRPRQIIHTSLLDQFYSFQR
jgi:transposase